MKKFFAFAMAVVSMAAVMTSCNNDDADFIEQKAPAAPKEEMVMTPMDMNFMVAATADQLNYYDETYVIEVDGKQQVVKVADMMPATTDEASSFDSAKRMAESYEVEVAYFTFPLGKVYDIKSVKVIEHKLVIKADHPDKQFDYMKAAGFVAGAKEIITKHDIRAFKDLYGDDENVAGFIEIAAIYNL